MRRVLLSAAFFLLCIVSFGQTEIEGNNTFQTAQELETLTPTTGSIGNSDTYDYYKFALAGPSNFYIYLQVTNTGSTQDTLRTGLFNSLTIGGEYVGGMSFVSYVINPGETLFDTIQYCGLHTDDLFFEMNAEGTFDYNIEWFPASVAADEGYNDEVQWASPFSFNNISQGSIGYRYWGNQNYDTIDYFTTTLPAADYDSVEIKIAALANSCEGLTGIRYFLYKNGSTTPFSSGFLGGHDSLYTYQNAVSRILLNNMQQGDVLTVKLSANAPFSYKINYGYLDPYVDDEDNCCFFNATTITPGQMVGGNVGEYDTNTDTYIDEADTYKFYMPYPGMIKVDVTGVLQDCGNEYYYLYYDILDSLANETSTGVSLVEWSEYPECGNVKTASIRIRALHEGTYYIRLRAERKVNYRFKYTLADTATADIESNNTRATAIPISVGEVKKGNISFKRAYPYDVADFYRAEMPKDGKLTIHLKGKSHGDYETGTSNSLQVIVGGFNTTYNVGINELTIYPDSTYSHSTTLCDIGAGTVYFEVKNSYYNPWEYELSYEISDTTSLTNDVESNNTRAAATLIAGGEVKKGHLDFVSNETSDSDDYYKMVYATTDSLKLYIAATRFGCEQVVNRNIFYEVRNKNNAFLGGRRVGNVISVLTGQTVTDSLKIRVTAPDTIYIRMYNANSAFKYEITTNPMPPSSGFSLSGDTTVCFTTQTYRAHNIAGTNVTYNWSLPVGGGTLTFVDSVATVTWNQAGNRKVRLFLSNAQGNSQTKELNVIVEDNNPTQVPIANNFSRTLSTQNVPPGNTCQWYRNGSAIPGAISSTYYAVDAGNYYVKFVNDCGEGPFSNTISFPAAAQLQTISFVHTDTVTMRPNLRIPLKATSSSGLPVIYQLVSGYGTVVGDTAYVTHVAPVVIRAIQPGDDVYAPAAATYDTIQIKKGDQVITFLPIPDKLYTANGFFVLGASSDMGSSITYTIVSGNAAISSGSFLVMKGVGTVTVRASHDGNSWYNAATPVERTFCIGVRALAPITGGASPCLSTYTYVTQKIPGANFVWTLSGGGILTTHNDTAFVQWQTPGSYLLTVKANSPCDAEYTNTQEFAVTTSDQSPGVPTSMRPVDRAIDQQLPLKFSWVPGINSVSYDIYIWDSLTVEPTTPYKANIFDVSYTLPVNAVPHNRAYKWKVVAKNPCTQTSSPIQSFRVMPNPDITVSNVQAPLTANSGQTISISWKITNNGPGRTLEQEVWRDGVYLSFDTMPNFRASANFSSTDWTALTANGAPLLVAAPNNLTALDSGQSYTNSINFTIPVNYSQPLYAYVVANYWSHSNRLLQTTVANDTARAPQPIVITLSPTADLRVDSVFAPQSVFTGSTINVAYKVKNYGVANAANINWVDSVFISQNPLFDRSQAIPLRLPKTDGSYYPNAVEAAIGHSGSIYENNEVYTRNINVVIPNKLLGTWFIYVKTNATGSLYEGSLANNNVGQGQIEVFLTPTPKLIVNSLTLPVTNLSITQPFGVNWVIHNDGFYDNVEKNRGHYLTLGHCGFTPCAPNSVCLQQAILADSIVAGSSYWVDRVYLSKDSTGLNLAEALMVHETKHGVENSGFYADLRFCPASVYQREYNIDNVIKPNADFPKSVNFNIPSTLQPGNYYLYVRTNATGSVFQYPATQFTKRSERIVIVRPDLTVPSITAPSSVSGGVPVTVNYNVSNLGAGAVFNHERRDRLYVSTFSSFDASAQLVDTKTYTESVGVGEMVPHSFTYKFPAATTGARYFYVMTNADSTFRESNANNNTSVSTMTLVSAAMPTDLIVTTVQPADTLYMMYRSAYVKYTVTNSGTGNTLSSWTDSVFISCNPVFNRATSFFVAERIKTDTLFSGGSYTDSFYYNIPKMSYEVLPCFPEVMNSNAYIHVKTNANGGAYEGTNGSNNITASGVRIVNNPLVDHIVLRVNGADSATVGRPYQTSWTAKNLGYTPPLNYYTHYGDNVYFSTDSVFNVNSFLANSYLKYNIIKRMDTLNDSRPVVVPNIPTGNYYVMVYSNAGNSIAAEKIRNNNINLIRNAAGAAKKIHVTQPLMPDLTDSILFATQTVAVGQPITVIHRVTNKGVGPTYPNSFTNELFLSNDFLINNSGNSLLIASKRRLQPLLPGQSFDDTITVNIRANTVAANYVLIMRANSYGSVFESNHLNNDGFSFLNVFVPPSSDLLVENIINPDTVYLGYTIDTAKWFVRNVSANEARGISSDGIYLSKKTFFDSSAVLVGIRNKNINLGALNGDSVRLAPLVDNVVEGAYNVFVKTDLLNNILEGNEDNNTIISPTPIYVKVKPLLLGVNEVNTLHKVNRYYKLVIPDSLYGATIRVSLKTNDSLTLDNELFIGGGYIPTPANFDYKFDTPNYGNQQVIINSATSSVYYLQVRSVTPNAISQNITLRAEKLPFAVLNVNTNSGGNIGNVTVKITGSLFRDSMMAKLSNGSATIFASRVYYVNGTTVFATFNLQGKPLGVYDVTLTKPDASVAVMPSSFTIVPANNGGLITGGGFNTGSGDGSTPGCDPGAESGMNSQLVVELVVPPAALIGGRPVVIQINYTNPTNFDVPAQSRVLYSEADMKMAFTRAGVATGITALYLELVEQGGPPGIIRAGGSGSIVVHTITPRALPLDPTVLFKLK